MATTIADRIRMLEPDPWRKATGFSKDIEEAQKQLFSSGLTGEDAIEVLSDWIRRFQPCLFGRIAAAAGFLEYCILTPEDLSQSDEHIRDKIQDARRSWRRAGHTGKKSGFVILAISEPIAVAKPSAVVRDLAVRLCYLYLRRDIQLDTVHLDEVMLELNDADNTLLSWDAGVNYFCAQGDNRWWHDHRIPGGMAFSMNSVAHMAKAGLLANAAAAAERESGERFATRKVESLEKALEFAMRTIRNASNAPSGRATELHSRAEHEGKHAVATCPVALPSELADRDYCRYRGYYHTDHTIPSVYFTPEVERPASVPFFDDLDFTYLYLNDVDNPAYETMAAGVPVRASRGGTRPSLGSRSYKSVFRTIPRQERPAKLEAYLGGA